MLVDRAFSQLDVLQGRELRPDRAIWNALVQCAGLSGQLSRAFSLLEAMSVTGIKPNHVTFLTLIRSCNLVCRPRSLPARMHSQEGRRRCAGAVCV